MRVVKDWELEEQKINCLNNADALVDDLSGIGPEFKPHIRRFMSCVIQHVETLGWIKANSFYAKDITNNETHDYLGELNNIITDGRSFIKAIKCNGEPSKLTKEESCGRVMESVINRMNESLTFALEADELRRANLIKLQNGKLPANNNSSKKECEQVLKAFADTLRESKLVEPKVIDEFVATAGNCLNDVSNTKEWSRKVLGNDSRRKFYEEFKECFVNAKGSFKQGNIQLFKEEGVDGFIIPVRCEEKPSKENISKFLDMLATHMQIIKHEAFCGVGDKTAVSEKSKNGGHRR